MSFRTVYGYRYSENGWRMCNADATIIVSVAGMNLRVRAGAAADVLRAWMLWYHQNVERIDLYKPIDDWGWSATNDVGNSNHLSGTGIDINATQYPWGRRTMPAGRIAAVRRGLDLFEGNIFWGADWSRADEMHYQLGAGTAAGDGASARLEDFARRLRDGNLGLLTQTPGTVIRPPAVGRPVLRLGSSGGDVTYLQALLNRAYPLYSRLAVDGAYGPATEAVVREFQRRAGLVVDGVVGSETWRRLGVAP